MKQKAILIRSLSQRDIAKLDKLAKADDRSRENYIARIIRAHLEEKK